MKAVVLEIKNGYAAVLTDDGSITKVKNDHYVIGQTLQINNSRMQLRKKVSMIAAAAAAIIIMGTGTWSYASPYSYVSLDVNPSIEYTVNYFDRVIKVTAVNDDGEKIIENLTLGNLKNTTIKEAVTATVDQISDAGYFDGVTKGGIVITTSGKNNKTAKKLSEQLKNTVETEAAKNNDDIAVEACQVSMDRVENAHKLGVTPGKLNLVEKLKQSASDPSEINIKEWLNKPVKDIMKATKDIKKASKSSMKSSSSENDQIDKTTDNQDENNSIEIDSIDKTNDRQDTNNPVENDNISKNKDSAKKTAGKAEQKRQAYDKVKKISNKADVEVENNDTVDTSYISKKNKNTPNSVSNKATGSSSKKDYSNQISEGKETKKTADNSSISQNGNQKEQSNQSQIDKPNNSSEAQSDKQNETQKENNNTEQKGNSNKSEVKPSDETSEKSGQQSNANESSVKSGNSEANSSSDNSSNSAGDSNSSAGNSNSSAGNSNNSSGKSDNGNDNSRGKGNN